MAGKTLRRRGRGEVTMVAREPVVDRAVARVGWWLPETVVAAALAGLVLWAGIGWLVWPIAAGLLVRIGWEWPVTRRCSRVIAALAAGIARWRRRREHQGSADAAVRAGRDRDEVAS
jgi:MFS family permease